MIILCPLSTVVVNKKYNRVVEILFGRELWRSASSSRLWRECYCQHSIYSQQRKSGGFCLSSPRTIQSLVNSRVLTLMLTSQPWSDPELNHFVRTATRTDPGGCICLWFFTICEQQVRYSISQPLQHLH